MGRCVTISRTEKPSCQPPRKRQRRSVRMTVSIATRGSRTDARRRRCEQRPGRLARSPVDGITRSGSAPRARPRTGRMTRAEAGKGTAKRTELKPRATGTVGVQTRDQGAREDSARCATGCGGEQPARVAGRATQQRRWLASGCAGQGGRRLPPGRRSHRLERESAALRVSAGGRERMREARTPGVRPHRPQEGATGSTMGFRAEVGCRPARSEPRCSPGATSSKDLEKMSRQSVTH